MRPIFMQTPSISSGGEEDGGMVFKAHHSSPFRQQYNRYVMCIEIKSNFFLTGVTLEIILITNYTGVTEGLIYFPEPI